MKIRMLVLGLVLVVVAAVAVPAVALADTTTTATGTMVEGSISIIAPTLPGFGTFHAGNNDIVSSPDGSVTVIPGSNGNTGWSVTAISNPLDAGYMWTWNSNPARVQRLVTELQISNGGAYQNADTALTYTGSGNTANAFPLWARQFIGSTDTTMGLYSITITFTASLTGF